MQSRSTNLIVSFISRTRSHYVYFNFSQYLSFLMSMIFVEFNYSISIFQLFAEDICLERRRNVRNARILRKVKYMHVVRLCLVNLA